MKKALFLLSCSLGALTYETEGNVLKLGENDFNAALSEYPNMLVKFFAPWYRLSYLGVATARLLLQLIKKPLML